MGSMSRLQIVKDDCDRSFYRACSICETDNNDALPLPYSRLSWRLKECLNCGFVYLENPPIYEDLARKYAWEKTWAAEEQRKSKTQPVVWHLSKTLNYLSKQVLKRDNLWVLIRRYFESGNILDVGCGGGGVLSALAKGFFPFGIEISTELSRKARARISGRGKIVNKNAIEGLLDFEPEFFHGIILNAFLEHEAQPKTLLLNAHRILKSGSPIIIKVPNYGSINRAVRGKRWCGFRFPDHVNYFTPKTLTAIVRETGYRVCQSSFLVDRFPLNDNM